MMEFDCRPCASGNCDLPVIHPTKRFSSPINSRVNGQWIRLSLTRCTRFLPMWCRKEQRSGWRAHLPARTASLLSLEERPVPATIVSRRLDGEATSSLRVWSAVPALSCSILGIDILVSSLLTSAATRLETTYSRAHFPSPH